MRTLAPTFASLTVIGAVLGADSCSGDGLTGGGMSSIEGAPTATVTAPMASLASAPAHAPPTQPSSSALGPMPTAAPANPPPASPPAVQPEAPASVSPEPVETPPAAGMPEAPTPEAPATPEPGAPTPDPSPTPEPDPALEPAAECTDLVPDDRETCATWAEWGECDAAWLAGYCNASCGRCDGAMSVAPETGGEEPGTPVEAEPSAPSGPDLGDDNPYPPINGGSQGWGSRYWDCCKPSCGWRANASNPVVSCDKSDNGLGVTDERNSCEANGQSGAFTCHSMAPWAYSNKVAYGYAAVNGVSCGTCFQLQFTGSSHNAGMDPGSAALNGKTMIVQASNIGGIEQNQFDILIPGGGVGALNGCAGQWGIDNAELGAQYGGFLPACRQGNADHAGVKQCMRDKCQSVFGTRGLTELYDGCIWFVDWFEVADNPSFVYQQVTCPDEISAIAAGR